MNPWMWIVWAIVALVVLFVASAAIAAVVDAIWKPKCEMCGHVRGDVPVQQLSMRDLN